MRPPGRILGTYRPPRSRWWWGLLLVAALAALAQLGARASADVSWYLYAARQVLHGARYGLDILEINPPLIVWLKVPAVAVAEMLGVREATAWAALVTLLAAGSIWLGRRVLPEAVSPGTRGLPGIAVAAAVLLLLPGGDFGQREHVTILLALPYLLLAGRRLAGDPVPARLAVLVGGLACLGLVIKPYFVLVPLAVAVFQAARLGVRRAILPEHVALAVTGGIYIALVVLAAPEFFGYALRFGPLYRRFLELSPWTVAVTGEGVVPGYVALGAWAALRRRLAAPDRPLADAFAVAILAFQLTGIVQEKGWRYHFLPAMTCATALGAVLVAGTIARLSRPLDRVYHALAAGMLAALAAAPLPPLALRLAAPRHPALTGELSLDLLLPLVRAVGPDGHVALLSTNVASAFPLVQEGGSRWAFRQLSLWPLVALYQEQLDLGRMVAPRSFEDRGALETEFGLAVVADLERSRPDLLMVLHPDPSVSGWGAARHFDYLAYFSGIPGFTDRVLAHYRRAGVVGTYAVYVRAGAVRDLPLATGGWDRLRRAADARHAIDRVSLAFLIAGFLAGAAMAWRAGAARSPPSDQ